MTPAGFGRLNAQQAQEVIGNLGERNEKWAAKAWQLSKRANQQPDQKFPIEPIAAVLLEASVQDPYIGGLMEETIRKELGVQASDPALNYEKRFSIKEEVAKRAFAYLRATGAPDHATFGQVEDAVRRAYRTRCGDVTPAVQQATAGPVAASVPKGQ